MQLCMFMHILFFYSARVARFLFNGQSGGFLFMLGRGSPGQDVVVNCGHDDTHAIRI